MGGVAGGGGAGGVEGAAGATGGGGIGPEPGGGTAEGGTGWGGGLLMMVIACFTMVLPISPPKWLNEDRRCSVAAAGPEKSHRQSSNRQPSIWTGEYPQYTSRHLRNVQPRNWWKSISTGSPSNV